MAAEAVSARPRPEGVVIGSLTDKVRLLFIYTFVFNNASLRSA